METENTWQVEQRQKSAELFETARLVASHLGKDSGDWTVGPPSGPEDYRAVLVGPDGVTLGFCRAQGRAARWEVRASLHASPSSYDLERLGNPVREITVSADRSPVAIAADITRRLLPGATVLCTWSSKAKASAEAYAVLTDHTVGFLASSIDGASRDRHNAESVWIRGISPNLTVSGDRVTFQRTFTVSPATAVAIVKLLQAEEK